MPELVGLKAPELLIAISDIFFHGPFVNRPGELRLLVREVREARIRKQVGAIAPQSGTNLLLLRLNGTDDLLVYQRDDMFLTQFGLVKAQIPLMAIIANQAIRGKCAELPDP